MCQGLYDVLCLAPQRIIAYFQLLKKLLQVFGPRRRVSDGLQQLLQIHDCDHIKVINPFG